jgi:hypothetical protein
MSEIIYVLGYPKSGTTWLTRLLGDALNSPVTGYRDDDVSFAEEGADRPGPYLIRQGHAVPVEEGDCLTPTRRDFVYKHLTNERIVIMIRDPRDVAVSAAAHWGMDLTKTLHCMGRGEWPLTHGSGWCKWYNKWFNIPRTNEIYTYYEALHYYDVASVLRWLCGEHGLEPANDLDDVEKRQSLAARRAWTEQHGDDLNYGKERQLQFLRKGIVGDWRNHFTQEHTRLAEQYFGDLMRELSYE